MGDIALKLEPSAQHGQRMVGSDSGIRFRKTLLIDFGVHCGFPCDQQIVEFYDKLRESLRDPSHLGFVCKASSDALVLRGSWSASKSRNTVCLARLPNAQLVSLSG